jgi:hypothetical protein
MVIAITIFFFIACQDLTPEPVCALAQESRSVAVRLNTKAFSEESTGSVQK